MHKKALYLIPYPRFASQHNGVGGHVVHAYSVTRALVKAGFRTRILTEERIDVLEGPESGMDADRGAGIGADRNSGMDADRGNPSLGIIPLENTSSLHRILWGRTFVNAVRREIERNRPDFVYARYSAGFMNWLPALKRACGEVPLVLEVNSFKSQRLPMLKRPEGHFLKSADILIAISEVVWQGIHDRWGAALSDKTHIVTNGVDPDRFTDWEAVSEREPGNVVRIGYTGLIESWYDLDLIAEGFMETARQTDRTLELHFYGDGPYLSELQGRYGSGADSDADPTQSQIPSSQNPKIVFHGAKPYASMPEIMSGLDLLVNAESPAKAYTSPIKLMEYMASGRPVLSARTPQCEAMLGENEERGWLYELGDQDSFASALLRWLNAAQDERVAKSKAARKYVETSHTWDQRLQDILNLIRPLVQASK